MSLAHNPPFVRDFEFLDPVYMYGDQKLVCLRFLSICGKARPLRRETIFAVASIVQEQSEQKDTLCFCICNVSTLFSIIYEGSS